MKYICLFLFCLFANRLYCQNVKWNETTHWKIYNIRSKMAFNTPIDSLNRFKSIPLDTDSMKTFLTDVFLLPSEKTPVWMGMYVTSCQLKDGTIRKVEISSYGGFFYDEKTKSYYQIPLDLRSAWQSYLSDSKASLSGQ